MAPIAAPSKDPTISNSKNQSAKNIFPSFQLSGVLADRLRSGGSYPGLIKMTPIKATLG